MRKIEITARKKWATIRFYDRKGFVERIVSRVLISDLRLLRDELIKLDLK